MVESKVPFKTAQRSTHDFWQALRWEAKWIPIEFAMMASSLYVLLGLDYLLIGNLLVFLSYGTSGAVRYLRYRPPAEPVKR